jgi:hypothetical protein
MSIHMEPEREQHENCNAPRDMQDYVWLMHLQGHHVTLIVPDKPISQESKVNWT